MKVDELGRITIPEEFRNELECKATKDVFIKQIGNEMVLSFEKKCLFYGSSKKGTLTGFKSVTICNACINAINHDELFETVINNEFHRSVDELFRVVLPEELCQKLTIHSGGLVYLYIEDKKLFIKSSTPLSCTICGDNVSLMPVADIYICKDCMNKLAKSDTSN